MSDITPATPSGESAIYQQTSVTDLPRNVAEVIALAKV